MACLMFAVSSSLGGENSEIQVSVYVTSPAPPTPPYLFLCLSICIYVKNHEFISIISDSNLLCKVHFSLPHSYSLHLRTHILGRITNLYPCEKQPYKLFMYFLPFNLKVILSKYCFHSHQRYVSIPLFQCGRYAFQISLGQFGCVCIPSSLPTAPSLLVLSVVVVVACKTLTCFKRSKLYKKLYLEKFYSSLFPSPRPFHSVLCALQVSELSFLCFFVFGHCIPPRNNSLQ